MEVLRDQNQLIDHQSWTDHHGKFHEKNAFLGLEKCRTHISNRFPLSKVTKQIQKLYFRFGQSIRSPQRNRTPLPYLPQQSWGHTASRVFFGFVQSLRMWVKECHKTHHPPGKSPFFLWVVWLPFPGTWVLPSGNFLHSELEAMAQSK